MVVIDGSPAPYRETIKAEGWIVELFVHSRASLSFFYDFDARTRTCTLARMCADGYVLRDTGDEAADVQFEARALIDSGPDELTSEELLQRRYRLTDLLDDLRGTSNETEVIFIAGQLIEMAGELALLSQRRWIGSGKWLARHLEEAPGDLGSRLARAMRALAATADKMPKIDVIDTVLQEAGGPITEGFIAHKPVD